MEILEINRNKSPHGSLKNRAGGEAGLLKLSRDQNPFSDYGALGTPSLSFLLCTLFFA